MLHEDVEERSREGLPRAVVTQLQQQWQLQGSPPVHANSSTHQVHPAVPARLPAPPWSPNVHEDPSTCQVHPSVPAHLPAPPWSPNVHEDSSTRQVHPAVPARAPAPGALNSHRFTLTPEPGLQLCIVVSCKILSTSNQQWEPPPRVWRPPSSKKPVLSPHNFAGRRSTVGKAPGQTPKAEVRAGEELEEAMEVDNQVLGPCSNVRDPNNPAPAVLPGPVPGCSQVLGKDHLRNSSDSPMEWEDTQPKDAAALPASSCYLPTAGSQSLRLVPPQEWRWGELRGPYPLNVPADPRKDSETPQGDVQDQHPRD
ncbi:putative UPF0607 protein ENSP00000383783 [Aotus nancymaae]|uniref:putative UPF0607 protein ENSP00000383783 n=1 Tax=Aotus nancymaae TaxID=37293 RepID=UPI0030FE4E78